MAIHIGANKRLAKILKETFRDVYKGFWKNYLFLQIWKATYMYKAAYLSPLTDLEALCKQEVKGKPEL